MIFFSPIVFFLYKHCKMGKHEACCLLAGTGLTRKFNPILHLHLSWILVLVELLFTFYKHEMIFCMFFIYTFLRSTMHFSFSHILRYPMLGHSKIRDIRQ
ncbi:hypothetical protein F4805DRAFT_61220 [Annulohypoxylon moriforme]|nr:hypothetical protein F4805DRAFT_61220 [Annulohypoxylon moriforme]